LPLEAKSRANADLVDCYFLGTGNKKQEGTGKGRKKPVFGQLSGNRFADVELIRAPMKPWTSSGQL
jgi:hypothetical protein